MPKEGKSSHRTKEAAQTKTKVKDVKSNGDKKSSSKASEVGKTKSEYGMNRSNLTRSVRRTIIQAVKACEKLNGIAGDIGDSRLGMVVVWEKKGSIKTVGKKALLKKVTKVKSPQCCNHGDDRVSQSSQLDEGYSSQEFAEIADGENVQDLNNDEKPKTPGQEVEKLENNVDNSSKGSKNRVGLEEKGENILQTSAQCELFSTDSESERKENKVEVCGRVETDRGNDTEKNRKDKNLLNPRVVLTRIKLNSPLTTAPSTGVKDSFSKSHLKEKEGTLAYVKGGKRISIEELKKQVKIAINSPKDKIPKFYLRKTNSDGEKTTGKFRKTMAPSPKELEKVLCGQTLTFLRKDPKFPEVLTTVAGIETPKVYKDKGYQSEILPTSFSNNHHTGEVSSSPHNNGTQNSSQLKHVSDLEVANAQNSSPLEGFSDSTTESCTSEEDLRYSIVLQRATDTGEYDMYKVPIPNTHLQNQDDVPQEQQSERNIAFMKNEPVEETSDINNTCHSQSQSDIPPTEVSGKDEKNDAVKIEPKEPNVSPHYLNTNIDKYKNSGKTERPKSLQHIQGIVEYPSAYLLHVDTVHMKESDVATYSHHCKMCRKSFRYANSQEVHQQAHNHDKNKHQCYICGKVCSAVQYLNIHIKSHQEPTDKSENAFKCFKCDESFFYNENFKVHMKTHVHKYMTHCSKCGDGFHHKAQLLKHMKIHKGQKVIEKNESVNTASSIIQPMVQIDMGTPVEETEYRNEKRSKRKRRRKRMTPDGLISKEMMKRQFRDTSNITTPMEFAPPTKKLMHLKENGAWERLLSCPGRHSLSKTASKSFTRNLITQTMNLEEEPDSDQIERACTAASLEMTNIKEEPSEVQLESTTIIQTDQTEKQSLISPKQEPTSNNCPDLSQNSTTNRQSSNTFIDVFTDFLREQPSVLNLQKDQYKTDPEALPNSPT